MTGVTKVAMLIFFISHIPITILIDSQALGSSYHPPAAVALCKWYVTTLQDPLMRPPCHLWFSNHGGVRMLHPTPILRDCHSTIVLDQVQLVVPVPVHSFMELMC
jgi:hypothetical protein